MYLGIEQGVVLSCRFAEWTVRWTSRVLWDCDRKKSAVFLHMLSHPKCLQVYDDLSVCILLYKPDLCKRKRHVVAFRLFS